MTDSGKISKVSVEDIKVKYWVNELIKGLLNQTTSGCATKYRTPLKLMEDFHLSKTLKVLSELIDNMLG